MGVMIRQRRQVGVNPIYGFGQQIEMLTRHKRSFDVTYSAVAANLPPLIPPIVDPPRFDLMEPIPDTAFISSDFEGRGPEAGLRLTVPLVSKKIFFDAEFGIAILRGEATTAFTSRTHFYGVMDGNEVLGVLFPPYDALLDPVPGDDNPILADFVRQIEAASGLEDFTESMTGSSFRTGGSRCPVGCSGRSSARPGNGLDGLLGKSDGDMLKLTSPPSPALKLVSRIRYRLRALVITGRPE